MLLLLCEGFSSCSKPGATLHQGSRASYGSGFSCCRAQALVAVSSVPFLCLSGHPSRSFCFLANEIMHIIGTWYQYIGTYIGTCLVLVHAE